MKNIDKIYNQSQIDIKNCFTKDFQIILTNIGENYLNYYNLKFFIEIKYLSRGKISDNWLIFNIYLNGNLQKNRDILI